jgi:His/Glu/Gln/Arg/opine family amino acid ABC transporter permease subunit
MDFNLLVVKEYLPFFISGFINTISIAAVSLLFSIIVGIIGGLCKTSKNKIIFNIASIYVNLIRSTPLLAQLYLIFYGFPYIGIRLSPFVTGVIALTLNSGAYITEIVRSGIQAIPKGQTDASLSMGMNYYTMMRKIILPQALFIIIPALVGQSIVLVKDTCLLSIIAYHELTRAAEIVVAYSFSPNEGYLTSCLLYLIIGYGLGLVANALERKKKIRLKEVNK